MDYNDSDSWKNPFNEDNKTKVCNYFKRLTYIATSMIRTKDNVIYVDFVRAKAERLKKGGK